MKTPHFRAAFSALHLSSTHFGAAGQIRTADLILTKKPSCFLVSTYSCHGIPPNPLRYKGFGVFHCSSHVICFFLILGHFSLFVGRFVGTLLASPTIFFIFYTLLDSSQCPLAREVICRNRHQTFTLQFVAGFGFWFLQGYLQKVTLRHKSKPDGTASYDNNFVIRQSLFLG